MEGRTRQAGGAEGQGIGVLKGQELGVKTADPAHRHGVLEATVYNWKAKYGGLEVGGQAVASARGRDAKLKRLLAEATLDNAGLKNSLAENW